MCQFLSLIPILPSLFPITHHSYSFLSFLDLPIPISLSSSYPLFSFPSLPIPTPLFSFGSHSLLFLSYLPIPIIPSYLHLTFLSLSPSLFFSFLPLPPFYLLSFLSSPLVPIPSLFPLFFSPPPSYPFLFLFPFYYPSSSPFPVFLTPSKELIIIIQQLKAVLEVNKSRFSIGSL